MPGTSYENWFAADCLDNPDHPRHPRLRFFNPHSLHHNICDRPISGLRRRLSDFLHDIHSFDYLPEHSMLSIQVRSGRQRDEKLAAVRVWAGVRHREDSLRGVFQLGMKLVRKLIPGSATSGAGWIAALNHEAVDDSMEDNAIVEFLLCKLHEILNRLWCLLRRNSTMALSSIESSTEDNAIVEFLLCKLHEILRW